MTGSLDGTVKQWDLTRLVPMPPSSSLDPSTPHYQPDPDSVAISSYHCGSPITCLMFDDARLVAGSQDTFIRQFDLETGKQLQLLRFDATDSSLQSDTKQVASGMPWDMPILSRTGSDDPLPSPSVFHSSMTAPLATSAMEPVYDDKPSGLRVNALQFRQHALVAGYADGKIRLWDTRTQECFRTLAGGHISTENTGVTCLKLDEVHVWSSGMDGFIKVLLLSETSHSLIGMGFADWASGGAARV